MPRKQAPWRKPGKFLERISIRRPISTTLPPPSFIWPGSCSSAHGTRCRDDADRERQPGDRKSTRLNSSHSSISYAVFCLKKKKIDAGAIEEQVAITAQSGYV